MRLSFSVARPPRSSSPSSAAAATSPGGPVGAPVAEEPEQHEPIPLWVIVIVFLAIWAGLVVALYEPWHYRTNIRKAETAMAEGRWKDAIELWNKHGKDFKAQDAPKLRRDLAYCQLRAGLAKDAVANARFALDKSTNTASIVDLLEILGEAQEAAGDSEGARKTWTDLLDLGGGKSVKANIAMGRRLLREGKVLEATKYLAMVPVDKYPDDLARDWGTIEQGFLREVEKNVGAEAMTSPTMLKAPTAAGSDAAGAAGAATTSTSETLARPATAGKSGS